MMRLFLVSIVVFVFAPPVSAKVPTAVMTHINAVVTISVYRDNSKIGTGTGFIVDPVGLIATNYHVVADAGEGYAFAVRFKDGSTARVEKIIAVDRDHDLALLKIRKARLSKVTLSSDHGVAQGDDVVVVGSPLGLDLTISTGIVSGIRGSDRLLQITAPISAGSSGSPVFNVQGTVVGVATMLVEGGQNLNFAIPVRYLRSLMEHSTAGYEVLKGLTTPDVDSPSEGSLVAEGQLSELHSRLETEPNNPQLWWQIGEVHIANGHYKDAAKALDIALKFDSDNLDILAQKGVALYKLGRVKGAQELFERVLQAAPYNRPSLYYLGLIYRTAKGKKEEGIVLWQRYLTVDRDSSVADEIRGRIGAVQ